MRVISWFRKMGIMANLKRRKNSYGEFNVHPEKIVRKSLTKDKWNRRKIRTFITMVSIFHSDKVQGTISKCIVNFVRVNPKFLLCNVRLLSSLDIWGKEICIIGSWITSIMFEIYLFWILKLAHPNLLWTKWT